MFSLEKQKSFLIIVSLSVVIGGFGIGYIFRGAIGRIEMDRIETYKQEQFSSLAVAQDLLENKAFDSWSVFLSGRITAFDYKSVTVNNDEGSIVLRLTTKSVVQKTLPSGEVIDITKEDLVLGTNADINVVFPGGKAEASHIIILNKEPEIELLAGTVSFINNQTLVITREELPSATIGLNPSITVQRVVGLNKNDNTAITVPAAIADVKVGAKILVDATSNLGVYEARLITLR